MTGTASKAGDADSSRAPGLTSGLQGSVYVHRGALLLVLQWECISSFVFYIILIYVLEYKLKTKKTALRYNTIIVLKIETPCDKNF